MLRFKRGDFYIKNGKPLGNYGENVAAEYIQSIGYVILDRNYRCRLGEVDIIAKKDDIFIFIEVKTRRSTEAGFPAEAVTYTKQQKIINTARFYLCDKDDYSARFDVIEVYADSYRGTSYVSRVNHIENAFWEC